MKSIDLKPLLEWKKSMQKVRNSLLMTQIRLNLAVNILARSDSILFKNKSKRPILRLVK